MDASGCWDPPTPPSKVAWNHPVAKFSPKRPEPLPVARQLAVPRPPPPRARHLAQASTVRALPLDDLDRKHCQTCKDGADKCAQCKFAARKGKWFGRFPLDPAQPQQGSWLIRSKPGEPFAIGCAACQAVGARGLWASVKVDNVVCVQIMNVRNHERSKRHRDAMARLAGTTVEELALEGAPSMSAFEKTLRATWAQEGQGDTGIADVGGRKKLRCMKYCLAEAKRCIQRRGLRRAKTISLHQDATKGVIAMRFLAAGEDLEPQGGLLGMCNLAKFYGLSACDIKTGTLYLLKAACVYGHNAPCTSRQGKLDEALHQHILQSIELWDTDAAEDEVLAGKLLQGARPEAGGAAALAGERTAALLPALKIRNRDKPHGARRTANTKHCIALCGAAASGLYDGDRSEAARGIQNSGRKEAEN